MIKNFKELTGFTAILKKVSRTFYLSLRLLPCSARVPMAFGYLLARAADTIADTQILSADKRLEWLAIFKKQIFSPQIVEKTWMQFQEELVGSQTMKEEKELLQYIVVIFSLFWQLPVEDRNDLQDVVCQLITGMEQDVQRFPGNSPNQLSSLHTLKELDEYCFHAAGVVGPFWTKVMFRHLAKTPHAKKLKHLNQPQIELWAIDYGKGLQLINVIKDIASDYQQGRSYLPLEELKKHGINVVIFSLIKKSLAYLESGRHYVTSLPSFCYFFRLSALLPLWIGLETLIYLANDKFLLDTNKPHKISRFKLKVVIAQAITNCFFNRWINDHFESKKIKLLNCLPAKFS